MWEEGGRYPNVIVELLSSTTEAIDRGEKMQVYEQVFRTPEYFLFDPQTRAFEGHRLVGGRYIPIDRDANGRLASEQLDLLLGVHGEQLRFFTRDGQLVPTPDEAALLAQQETAAATREAEHWRRRAIDAEAELAKLRGSRDEHDES